MLPVHEALPALRAALAAHGVAVLQAPPGAGKTTVLPLELLGEPWLNGKKIVMLEPRRLAARTAARRMASIMGQAVGRTVGHRVRFDTRVSSQTRCEVVTEGVLTRMRLEDPSLEGIGLLIFDEFHERSIHADLGLALAIESRTALRPDLRILVMSATLDGERVASLLGGAPIITSTGRMFDVETRYRPRRADQRIESAVANMIHEALEETEGDILVFLPGAGEIERVAGSVRRSDSQTIRLFRLHGSLPAEQQDEAIAPSRPGTRKIVLATSIAETSLTIEGVRVVVDAGLMRVPRFSPRTGMSRLETIRVTRASADQRRGRAGRTAPGVCYRLWDANEERGLVPFNTPEILATDLAPLALDLAVAGVRDPLELAWLDPPPSGAYEQARALLTDLGALSHETRPRQITAHGKRMAQLPTHPRLAHMLLEGARLGDAQTAADLAALLSDRDVLRRAGGQTDGRADLPVDVTVRLEALRGARIAGVELDPAGASRARQESAALKALLPAGPSARLPVSPGALCAGAFPDRLGRRRAGAGSFLLANGRGASIDPRDPLAMSEWIVALDLDDVGSESRVRLAAGLNEDEVLQVAGERLETVDEIAWNHDAARVVTRRVARLGAIVIEEKALNNPDPERVRSALIDGVRDSGLEALGWNEDARSIRARLAFLRRIDPDWPDVSDQALLESLEAWLGHQLGGARKLSDIRVEGSALLALVPHALRMKLETLAPERIEVPTGSKIAVDYSDPSKPVLAVRLQEVFGLTETPRLAGGKVSLLMHLLSPAYRPMQVTSDLASFWKTGYFDVRKDLRGRYPKHHWPEDPLSAAPVRGAKRRR
ncbi:MAG TPA: ATP-dependent helicase HrpB [Gemmatimonadales bacterium]|nr:ATP-dependent helicase HrpB [Gemmatimonadales bacterium]